MDPKTLEALKASIEKWKRNAVAEKPHQFLTGVDDCPLCLIYHIRFSKARCKGCPIAEKTGQPSCDGTPYYKALNAMWRWEEKRGLRATAHKRALDMVAFLESLLPEGERT